MRHHSGCRPAGLIQFWECEFTGGEMAAPRCAGHEPFVEFAHEPKRKRAVESRRWSPYSKARMT